MLHETQEEQAKSYQEVLLSSLRRVVEGENLNEDEAEAAMGVIMDGYATPSQIASFITALRIKGETAEEITGFALAMRARVETLSHPAGQFGVDKLLDTCGTGGDGGKTFNISTAAALVAVSGGARVAKHGNRAVSSGSGSADVLEALGIHTQISPAQALSCLQETGFAFFFAPRYHGAMKYAAVPRKEIRIRTVFNLLGPLTNPAGVKRQVLGVYDKKWLETLPDVLTHLGVNRALVVASHDGLDEVSVSSTTYVAELDHGSVKRFEITPEDLGLARYPLSAVRGGMPQENARLIEQIFRGEETGGAKAVVQANAGAALYLAKRAQTWEEGVKLAGECIASGAANAKLHEIRRITEALSHDS